MEQKIFDTCFLKILVSNPSASSKLIKSSHRQAMGGSRTTSSIENGLSILEVHDNNDEYDKVLLFLHGVGGSGSEWVKFWKKILPNKTKLILPTAPKANVTMYGGIRLNSW